MSHSTASVSVRWGPSGAVIPLSFPSTASVAELRNAVAGSVGMHPTQIALNSTDGNILRDEEFVSKLHSEVIANPIVAGGGGGGGASAAAVAAAGRAVSDAASSTSSPHTAVPDPVVTGAASMAPPYGEQCAICLEPFVPEFPAVRTRCGHHFHESCVREWNTHSNYCPLCRSELIPPAPASSTSATAAATGPASTAAPAGVTTAAMPTVVILNNTTAPTKPPSWEDIRAQLEATRKAIQSSAEYTAIRKAAVSFANSNHGRSLLRSAEDVTTRALSSIIGGIVGARASPGTTTTTTIYLPQTGSPAPGATYTTAAAAPTGAASAGPVKSGTGYTSSAPMVSPPPGAATAAAPGVTLVSPPGTYYPAAPAQPTVQNVTVYQAPPSGHPPAMLTGGTAMMFESLGRVTGLWRPSSSVSTTAVYVPGTTTVTTGPMPSAAAGASALVQCPRCHQTLAPPAGAPTFMCPCGTVLQVPR